MEIRARRAHPLLAGLAFIGNLGHYIFPIGAVALLSVPAVLIYQLLGYIDDGKWPTLTFADGLAMVGLAPASFANATLQSANLELLAAPLALALLIVIGGPLFAYAQFSKWLERYCEPEKAGPEADAA